MRATCNKLECFLPKYMSKHNVPCTSVSPGNFNTAHLNVMYVCMYIPIVLNVMQYYKKVVSCESWLSYHYIGVYIMGSLSGRAYQKVVPIWFMTTNISVAVKFASTDSLFWWNFHWTPLWRFGELWHQRHFPAVQLLGRSEGNFPCCCINDIPSNCLVPVLPHLSSHIHPCSGRKSARMNTIYIIHGCIQIYKCDDATC